MKLINYKKGYSNLFDCSIHGTIKMTLKEWKKARKWLLTQNLFNIDIFKQDFKRLLIVKNGYFINIRVTATKLLSEKYKLNNYKDGNYQLFIKI
jgi:hypothetical protein